MGQLPRQRALRIALGGAQDAHPHTSVGQRRGPRARIGEDAHGKRLACRQLVAQSTAPGGEAS